MTFGSVALLGALLVFAPAVALAGPGEPGHKHDDTFAAGEPGNPKKVSRTIAVEMRDTDGSMSFAPDRIEVRRGETIRFVLKNAGELGHEFVLGTREENEKHNELMKRFPEMEHDDPNAATVAPGKTDGLVWRFTKAGAFEFACLVPGHYEAGMKGTVVVTEPKKARK